ncbi:thymidine kinase [Bdellovibrio bacteriovorus]|uniref:Thymidine kinase n=1 Tax=Bdellovibrio bacteriovorus TaxID=959 RepID=A0A150WXA1_BDEBC|nr:thymidine kinase [Bdellovibrio bacteriovorus]KYG70892.1 thymidine kinase [Bdellovibrio bacteriovorus]
MSEFSYVQSRGWIEIVVGSMFSGKTEELIRRLRRAEFARLQIQVFKPIIDKRYNEMAVTSHNMTTMDSLPIHDAEEIWNHLKPGTKVIGIDEGQFFSANLVQVAQDLADRGLRVIIAGLDTDWQGKPFEPMPTLMAIAESVTKQHAVCVVCGAQASRTQRTSGGDNQVLVGAHDSYEARCRDHFKPEVDQPTLDWKLKREMEIS